MVFHSDEVNRFAYVPNDWTDELSSQHRGGILGSFVTGGNPRDAMRVKKAMHLLRRLAESL